MLSMIFSKFIDLISIIYKLPISFKAILKYLFIIKSYIAFQANKLYFLLIIYMN